MTRSLAAFIFLAMAPLGAIAESELPDPITLPTPPSAEGGGQSGSIALSLVKSTANKITDDEAWWERNGLEKPEVFVRFPAVTRGAVPAGAPENYQGQSLLAVWKSSGRRFFVYGEDIYHVRYLLAEAEGGRKVEYALDARAYGTVAWAAIVDGILYLCNNPGNLSAADGGGAKIFAIDLKTNLFRWASAEKTGSGQFAVIAGSLVCAYGFTGEPDYIYVLDRFTGELSQTIKLKTAAKWLIEKGDLLHVRCYNTDNVYRIEIQD